MAKSEEPILCQVDVVVMSELGHESTPCGAEGLHVVQWDDVDELPWDAFWIELIAALEVWHAPLLGPQSMNLLTLERLEAKVSVAQDCADDPGMHGARSSGRHLLQDVLAQTAPAERAPVLDDEAGHVKPGIRNETIMNGRFALELAMLDDVKEIPQHIVTLQSAPAEDEDFGINVLDRGGEDGTAVS